MVNNVHTLILDMLEWIGPHGRPYSEVIAAWRTSCPRLTVWEDAHDLGFLEHAHLQGEGVQVSVSARGKEFLEEHRPNVRSR